MPLIRLAPVLVLFVIFVVASLQTVGPAWMSYSGGQAAAISAPTECSVAHIVDGDTVDLICHGHGEVRGRLTGLDAPEIFDPACPEEARLGRAAATRLREALDLAEEVVPEFGGVDRYGRHLVRLELDGDDITETLLDEGFAVPYSGGPRTDWCAQSG